MYVLDLFSGIGGFSLGLERAGMHTVAFCEKDAYCRAVLKKHWPDVPCFEDIHGIDADGLDRLGRIDLVCGGFPCQPWSNAGKQLGKADDRHLWPEMRRVIALARPTWVIGENVTGLIALALDDVLADLEGLGYTARTFVIPAAAVGAPHRRDRIWIVAHANGVAGHEGRTSDAAEGTRGRNPDRSGQCANVPDADDSPQHDVSIHAEMAGTPQPVANAEHGRLEGRDAEWQRTGPALPSSWWSTEPDVGRVAHGVPARVDRLRCLGNAVVPQIVEEIGRAILSMYR